MRLCRLAAALLAVAYPALVYYGLTRFEPRVLGLLLLAILLLRQGSRTLAFWCSAPRGERTLILAMLADVIDHIEFKSGIRTDGLTMSIYSSLMVAATPVCNAIFSGILNASGYDQSADVALNTLGQSAAVNTAISVSYIWVETAAYALCAVLVFLWTVEKNLPAEQAAIVERKKGATQ